MIEIAAGGPRGGLVAGRKPHLREMRLIDVVGRALPAHLGRDPAGRHRIRQHIGPKARDGESQHDIVQLALAISCRSVPAPLAPQDIVEKFAFGSLVHARAQIDEALRPFDQRGQDIGRERVDGEDMRQAVARQAMPFAIADGGVVNARVERAEPVDLLCNVLGAGDAGEVADNDIFGLGQGRFRVHGARVVQGVKDDPVGLDPRKADRPSNQDRRTNP